VLRVQRLATQHIGDLIVFACDVTRENPNAVSLAEIQKFAR
jgi:hypothetical protein